MTRLLVLLLLLFSASCKSTPPTGPQPTAQLQLSANPTPIAPTTCPPANCGALADQVEALTVLTVRETAGVNGRIDSISMTLRRTSDNVLLANGTIAPAGGQRFAANAATSMPIGVHYDQAQAGAPATLTLVVSATDDNSHAVTATLTIPVGAFGQ